jgi:hypothetical protein
MKLRLPHPGFLAQNFNRKYPIFETIIRTMGDALWLNNTVRKMLRDSQLSWIR